MISVWLTRSKKSLHLLMMSCCLDYAGASIADSSESAFQGKTVEFPKPYVYPMNKGAGYETVQKCAICHSFGYILNQGKQPRSFWQHETHKMVATYKAPITPDDEQVIVDYLSRFYGNGKE